MDNNPEGEVPTVEEPVEGTTEKTPEQLEQIAQDQKRRAEKAEEENKTLKEKLGVLDKLQDVFTPEETPPEGPDTNAIQGELNELKEIMSLKDLDFSTEEAQKIQAYAKAQDKPVVEVAKDPFIKNIVEGIRAKDKVGETTPPPSDKPITSGPIEGKKDDVKFDDDGKVIRSKKETYPEYLARTEGSNE